MIPEISFPSCAPLFLDEKLTQKMDESHKIYDEYLFPNKLRKLCGPSMVKKSGQKNDNEFSYICLSGSCEAGKLMSEHYLLRFSPQRKLKRKYHGSLVKKLSVRKFKLCLRGQLDLFGKFQSFHFKRISKYWYTELHKQIYTYLILVTLLFWSQD